MAENTGIEWAKHTWSPWRGCTKVSDGCKNCYADKTAKRNPKSLGVWGPQGKRVVNANWQEPLKWNKQAETAGERWRIFPSMCDPFEDWDGPMFHPKGHRLNSYNDWNSTAIDGSIGLTMADARKWFFDLIVNTPNLDWLVLTKRPENLKRMLPRIGFPESGVPGTLGRYLDIPSMWLGTSTENQATADERIPHLLSVPAAVRFLSVEPLLGPIDLTDLACGENAFATIEMTPGPDGGGIEIEHPPRINWVIVGGESGHGARPCDITWIYDIVRQCKAAKVPVFVKQLGANPRSLPTYISNNDRLRDPKGGDWNEWPEELRVREFPEVSLVSP